MPADPAKLQYFVDESVLGVGKALAIVRSDLVHTGHALIPEVPLGALDTEWMPATAARELVVISRDRRIRTKPAEILKAHALRVFWIAGKRDLGSWDNLVRLVRRWNDIERIIRTRGPGPWFMSVNEGAVREIPL